MTDLARCRRGYGWVLHRVRAMTPLGFSPDINALVTVILALTTRLCLIAAHDLMPREAAACAG